MVMLAALSALAPLGVDMYLPAFPAMAEEFGTSASAVQLTLTAFLIGLALGQARSAAGHRPSAGAERQAAPNPAPASSTQAGRTAGQAPGKAGRPAQLAASELGLLLGFIAFYSALHIFTWAMVRYRLPVDAVALPFAALAVVDLASRLFALLPQKRGQSPDLHP